MCATLKIYWRPQNTIQNFTAGAVLVNMCSVLYGDLDTGYQSCELQPFYCLWLLSGETIEWPFPHPSFQRCSVKVPLCHVRPWGHSLALRCQRWAAIWIHIQLAESSSILCRRPLMSDSADTPEEDSGRNSVWVTRFPVSNFLLRCCIFSELIRVTTQCTCRLAC